MSVSVSFRILLFLIVFTPSFFGYVSLGLGQIIYLTIVLVYLFFLYVFSPKRKLNRAISFFLSLFLLQSLCYLITLLFAVLNGHASYRDYFEPFRPLIYCSFFLCPLVICINDKKIILYLRRLIVCSMIFDLIKFLPFGYLLLRFYTPFEFDSLNYLRFSSVFGFCYNFGFLALLLFFYSWFHKENALTYRYGYVILFAIGILLTGSRSVIAAFLWAIGISYLLYVKGVGRKIRYTLWTIVLFIALYNVLKTIDAPIVTSTLQYVERLVDAMFGDGSDGSYDTRQNQFSLALSYFSQNYLFGIGSMKGSNEPIEMLLGYYLSSWGIVGTMVYLALMVYFLKIAYYSSTHALIKDDIAFSKANMIWILTIPVVGMSTPITDQVRVFNLFYIVQGLQFLLYIKLKYATCNTHYYRFESGD